jgi:hypothetical protein
MKKYIIKIYHPLTSYPLILIEDMDEMQLLAKREELTTAKLIFVINEL